jgi:hypothetical protein
MALPDPLQTHSKLLKLPLIITVVVMVLIVAGAFVWHRSKSAHQPTVIEATHPAVILGNVTFYKEENEYVLYFSLYDQAQQEIARTGEATIKLFLLGTVGIEGGPEFISETVLLDAKVEVGRASYRWVDVGGGLFFSKRQLIVPTRIPPTALKRVPPSGARCKLSIEFRDAKEPASKLRQERIFLFP